MKTKIEKMFRYLYYRITKQSKFRMRYSNGDIGKFYETYQFQKWRLRNIKNGKIIID